MSLQEEWEAAESIESLWESATPEQPTENPQSGFLRGLKDPVDAIVQTTWNVMPAHLRKALFNNAPKELMNDILKEQEKVYQAGRKTEGDTGFDWDRFAGTMTTSLLPAGGAAKIMPATVGGKIATGAGTGALYSQLAPVYNDKPFIQEKLKQAALGGTVGAAIPAVVETGRFAGRIVDELTRPMKFRNKGFPSGIARDTQDYLEEIADNKEAVIKALSKAKPGETSGQTLARSGTGSKFIKLEQEIAKRAPSDKAQALYRGQEQARKGLIKGIAGTDEDMAKALTARGGVDYASAFKNKITGNKELAEIFDNPYIKKAAPTAQDLSEAKGINPKSDLTEYLHYVKIGLDKQLSKTGDDALAKTEKEAARQIKSKLLDWIKKKNPAYDEARAEFAEKSIPINRMEVGKQLEKGLTTSTEKESASPFLTATREAPRTIQRATGFPHEKLDDILDPEQMDAVKKVSDELLMSQRFKDITSKTKSPYGVLTEEAKLQIAPMLERNVMIANALLRRLGRKATPEYEKVAWDILKDPKHLTKILDRPKTNKTRQLIERLIQEEGIAVSSQTTAREVQ